MKIINSLGMTLSPDVTYKRTINAFHQLPKKISKITKHNEKGVCKYTYDKVVYVNSSEKVIITCKIHGDFKQTPNSHLKGCGCSKCSGKYRRMTEEWVLEAIELHGNTFSYGKAVFGGVKKKIPITCKVHGDFDQIAEKHLQGCGCQQCNWDKTNYETYKGRSTTLYYVKFTHPKTNVMAWKIGLTLKTVEERFKPEINSRYLVDIIATKLFSDGWEAYKLEQYILKLFKESRPYDNTNNPYLHNQGNTEVFNKDVLDTELLQDYLSTDLGGLT